MRRLPILALLAASALVHAERLTIERIFSDPDLNGPSPRALKIAPDGSRVTFLRGRADDQDQLDLWQYEVASGETRRLVDSAAIAGHEELSDAAKARRERERIAQFKGIVAYRWAPDSRKLLFSVGERLWLYDFDAPAGKQLRALTPEGFEVNDAKVSPRGRYVSFVSRQNLYAVDLASGLNYQLTRDGKGALHNGEAEFVAQEEMDRSTGYWWAPDDSAVAYERYDESGVDEVERSEVDADRSRTIRQRYPAAGRPNVTVRLGVVKPHGGATRWSDARSATRVSRGDGWHDAVFGDNAAAYIDTWSARTPPQVSLHRADGSRIAWIEHNELKAGHPYWPYRDSLVEPHFGTLESSDGQLLHYRLYQPLGFDASQRYPVFVTYYGGPGRQYVNRAWGNHFEQYMAQHGYVVFALDNRGTPRRGRRFSDAILGQFGKAEVADQLVGIDWLRAQPWVDARRIGVFGWSYGGYQTLMLLAKASARIAAGVAVAPVTDWSLYDTHYTERYLGTPQHNAPGYERSGVLHWLDGIAADKLLLVHGMADDNVLFANSTKLMAALQQRGTQFRLMTYPGAKHGLSTPALKKHVYTLIADYFDEKLKSEVHDESEARGPNPKTLSSRRTPESGALR
jgi:dipeptidyl aminopeptidase/acylaminoacyl peptidase